MAYLPVTPSVITEERRTTMSMRVDLADGRCRTCGSALDITDCSDIALFCECSECGDSYEVETDAFGDGCMTYLPAMMATKMQEGDDT
jgi:hypothetical protein